MKVVYGTFPLRGEDGTRASAPVFICGPAADKHRVADSALSMALRAAHQRTGQDFELAVSGVEAAGFLHEYTLEETIETLMEAFGPEVVMQVAVRVAAERYNGGKGG